MYYFDIHTHTARNFCEEQIEFLNVRFPSQKIPANRFHTLGIHPWDLESMGKDVCVSEMEKHLQNPYCVGIGECGLDFSKKHIDKERQIAVFSEQIALSETTQLPLVIHCVRTFHELFRLHKLYQPKQAWIVHGFRGNTTLSEQLVKKGIFISFGKTYLSPSSEKLAKTVPLHALFFETDEADISVKILYNQAAHYYNVDVNIILECVQENVLQCFTKWKPELSGNQDDTNILKL